MRLTPVQRDVIERLKDGWMLVYEGGEWMEVRYDKPRRHVSTKTVEALYRRCLITPQSPVKPYWVLVDGSDVRD